MQIRFAELKELAQSYTTESSLEPRFSEFPPIARSPIPHYLPAWDSSVF